MAGIMDMFEGMPLDDALDRYGWGCDMVGGSTVYHRFYVADEVGYDVFVGNDGGLYSGGMGWYCELIEDAALLGSGWGKTPEDAVRAAYIDGFGWMKLGEEGCCEDNVNLIAYSAYESFHGCWPDDSDGIAELDRLLGLAADFVIEHGPSRGIEWHEYRYCMS